MLYLDSHKVIMITRANNKPHQERLGSPNYTAGCLMSPAYLYSFSLAIFLFALESASRRGLCADRCTTMRLGVEKKKWNKKKRIKIFSFWRPLGRCFQILGSSKAARMRVGPENTRQVRTARYSVGEFFFFFFFFLSTRASHPSGARFRRLCSESLAGFFSFGLSGCCDIVGGNSKWKRFPWSGCPPLGARKGMLRQPKRPTLIMCPNPQATIAPETPAATAASFVAS